MYSHFEPEITSQQMKHHLRIFLWISFALIAFHLSGFAQQSKEEKEQIKNFGSSLKQKRKQPDKKKNEKSKVESTDEGTIRIETNLIVNDFLVLDKQSKTVTGLKKEDFIVKEDDQPQEIEIFSPGDNAELPRSIVLMIDLTLLYRSYLFDSSLESAKVLIGKLNPKDKVAIVTDEIKLVQPFTEDKELLKKKLDSMKKDSLTRINGFQYESLLAILNEMFNHGETRPIVIALTQGDMLWLLKPTKATARPPLPDSLIKSEPRIKSIMERIHYRNLSYEEVYIAAEKSRATIYTIIPGLSLIGYSQDEQIERLITMWEKGKVESYKRGGVWKGKFGLKTELKWLREMPLDQKIFQSQLLLIKQVRLAELAEATGGWAAFLEGTSERADAIFSRIFSDINQRYTIGYYSTNENRDGKRRTIKIEIKNHPEYTVFGRKTYLAPTSP